MYLQTIVEAPVKFQKDQLKTVGVVARTKCIHTIYVCGIGALKSLS